MTNHNAFFFHKKEKKINFIKQKTSKRVISFTFSRRKRFSFIPRQDGGGDVKKRWKHFQRNFLPDKLTPHPFFERAFQSFLSQSFTLTQQASGGWSAVRMRATGWPDNFADTWELQMLPRASSLLNVSVEAVRRLAARFFSASFHFRPSLRIFFFPSFSFSPPSRVLLSTLSFFFFFFLIPRGVTEKRWSWQQWMSSAFLWSWKGGHYFFRSISFVGKVNFLSYFRPMF